jgi:superfamily II DNA/RNA helicase
MFQEDRFIIGNKNQNIYDLQSADDAETNQMLEEGDIEIYNKNDFKLEFSELLKKDLQILEDIQTLWNSVKIDFKLKSFINELNNNEKLKNKKIVIFSESKETCSDLFKNISKEVSNKCMVYTSEFAKINDDNSEISLSRDQSRNIITENFNPNIDIKYQKNSIQILISTDVLAEGFDLHRSNIVINYDLPWNPTRVIQRVGRVNRVGSTFKNILIFNFFPSTKGGKILNQEENITSKIQAIHDCLGNDAKYLTENEETETYYLLGGKSGKDIFNTINSKETYDKDEAVDTRQKYINYIRNIRDKSPDLFNKIIQLPKKIKSSKKNNINDKQSVITFFRKGKFKEFVITEEKNKETQRLNFLDAIKYFQCTNEEKKTNITKNFFDNLRQNKNKFEKLLKTATFSDSDLTANSNEFKIISLLNSDIFSSKSNLSDEDNDDLLRLRRLFNDGRITPFLIKKIINKFKESETENDPVRILYLVKDLISNKLIKSAYSEDLDTIYKKKEIILSLNLNG